MREIKFRVWDNHKKNLLNLDQMDKFGYYLTARKGDDIDSWKFQTTPEWESKAHRFEVMQFTGLKDKNGKEIYEGDIIKYEYSEETSLSEPFYPKYIVTWDELNNKWCFVQPRKPDGNVLDGICTGGMGGQELNRYFKIEVIGNIYKNPELLKVQE